MSRIERRLIDSIISDKSFRRDNTAYNHLTRIVYLNMHPIAKINNLYIIRHSGVLVESFNLTGYSSTTTLSRLRALRVMIWKYRKKIYFRVGEKEFECPLNGEVPYLKLYNEIVQPERITEEAVRGVMDRVTQELATVTRII